MKRGKYQIQMVSDDVYFASRQVDKLLQQLLKKQGKMRVVLPPIEPEPVKEEKPVPEPKIIEKPAIAEKQPEPEEIKEAVKEDKVEKIFEAVKQKLPEPKEIKETVVEVEIEIEEPEEVAEVVEPEIIIEEPQAVIEEVEEEIFETEAVPPTVEQIEEIAQKATENIDFGEILAEKASEIEDEAEEIEEEEEAPPVKKKTFSFKKIISEKLNASSESAVKQKSGFKVPNVEKTEAKQIQIQDIISPQIEEDDEEITKILEEKIKKTLPVSEPKVIIDEEPEEEGLDSLGDLLAAKNPQSKLDYMLLTAYYLQSKENLFKYSLKQLNSHIMPYLGSLIDHSVIHNAVALNYIEVVPDFNGTTDVTEYKLTEEGENYLLNEL